MADTHLERSRTAEAALRPETNVRKYAGINAFSAALEAGLGRDEAKKRSADAMAAVAADEAVTDAVRAAFRRVQIEKSQLGAEAGRLRREREALLRALAKALNVSESRAWQIARLDLEEDEQEEVA